MASRYTFQMEKFLECPICLNQCEDPRVLPCLHSLCFQCLQQHVQTSAQGARFNCPSCRRDCDVPPGGVAALPKNFMLNTLRELLKEGQTEQMTPGNETGDTKQCSNSNKGNVQHTAITAYCVDCAAFFCATCESFHKMFDVSADHQIRPASEVNTKDVLTAEATMKSARCDQHRRQYIDMYCDTCSVAMCIKCCLLTHQQHKYRELDQKGEESKTDIEKMMQTASIIMQSLERRLQELKTSERNIEKDEQETSEQVRKTADELREFITQQEQLLVQKIQHSKEAGLTDVKAAYKETELNKAAVQSLHSYLQALLTAGSVIDQVTHSPGLREQLQTLEALHQQSSQQLVSWTVNLKRESQCLAELNAMFGIVSVNKEVITSSVIDDSLKRTLGDSRYRFKPDVGHAVSGLAMIGDMVYVTGLGQPYLYVHNMKTHANKRHAFKGLKAVGLAAVPNDLNNSDNNTLVITNNNKKIHFVTISPQNMSITKHTFRDFTFQPRHVTLDSNTGKLVVANNTDNEIVICDNTGKKEKTVAVKTSIEDLRCVCFLPADKGCVVLDRSDRGQLHWVNQNGRVTHTYGQRDNEHLGLPDHFAIDSQKRLVVTDKDNDRLHLVDVNKRLSHYILTREDDIKSPTCVCLDETKRRLLVGHYDVHDVLTVSVYNWPFTQGTHHSLHVELKRHN